MVNGRVLNKLAMDHSSEQHHHVQWDTRQSEATVYYCLVAFYNRTFNYPWERGVPNKVSSDHGHLLATGRSLDNVCPESLEYKLNSLLPFPFRAACEVEGG